MALLLRAGRTPAARARAARARASPQGRAARVVLASSAAGAGAASPGGAEGAGAPGPEADPYKVLGVTPLTPAEKVSSAYNKLLVQAGDDQAKADAVESAYNSILSRQLSARVQGKAFGGVSMSSSVRFADRPSVLPKWAPKRADMPLKRGLAINSVGALMLVGNMLVEPKNGLAVITVALAFFFIRAFRKLSDIDPSPQGDPEEKSAADQQKLLRSLGLVFGPMLAAVAGLAFLPQFVCNVLNLSMPTYLVARQPVLISLISIVGTYVLTTFYR